MKITGEVSKLESDGESAIITLSNVRASYEAMWRPYGPSISFRAPMLKSGTYRIGRKVRIHIEAK